LTISLREPVIAFLEMAIVELYNKYHC
jgi:hypothetical protein